VPNVLTTDSCCFDGIFHRLVVTGSHTGGRRVSGGAQSGKAKRQCAEDLRVLSGLVRDLPLVADLGDKDIAHSLILCKVEKGMIVILKESEPSSHPLEGIRPFYTLKGILHIYTL